jgi:hypothetical protein
MKMIIGLIALVVVAIVGYFGLTYYRIQQAATGPAKELISESMEKKGDTWHVSFTTKFAAPIDKVFEAFSHPERSQELAPENVLKSELQSDEGNKKVVNMVARLDILPPGFKVQNLRVAYTIEPEKHEIKTSTIDFKLADINSTYQFEATPDGGTLLHFTQTSKDKAPMLVEALQKGALREQYLLTVRAVNRALGQAPAAAPKAAAG